MAREWSSKPFAVPLKTTSIRIAFLAFRIGLHPEDSYLVLQATAAAAKATCRQVADLITNNPGWHIAFPHVVRDKEMGWSMANGYEVKRDDMDYSQWRKSCAETKGRDPSLTGLGYRSSFVVGLHPTGMLLADDIHNENNTRSTKELHKAVAIITSNILPVLNSKSWVVFIGTRWSSGDVLQYLKVPCSSAAGRASLTRKPPSCKPSVANGCAGLGGITTTLWMPFTGCSAPVNLTCHRKLQNPGYIVHSLIWRGPRHEYSHF